MKIAVLGAGFTGLTAAYRLAQQGHTVTIFEKEAQVGGLAVGFRKTGWDWTVERAYHHWFTNDDDVLNLCQEINQTVITTRPKTNVYIDGKILAFDSPQALLTFPYLSFLDRLRVGAAIFFLKLTNDYKKLEGKKAVPWIVEYMGQNSYKLIWEPLFRGKFGDFKDQIALTWFWARIKKRTQALAYPEGGFQNFADKLKQVIEKTGAQVLLSTSVAKITVEDDQVVITLANQTLRFDKVISTLPSPIFAKVTPQLPQDYVNKISSIPHLHAQNLILFLKKPFLNNTYWLNITSPDFPFLVLAEHTNFMDPSHYHNEHILYIGNYLPSNHPFLKLNAKQLLEKFTPYLTKISPGFESDITGYELFTAPFAQPVVTVNYSKTIPEYLSPLKNIYVANMDMVYPWDRGTNYAVAMGEQVANLVNE